MTFDDDELRAALREEARSISPHAGAWERVALDIGVSRPKGRWVLAAAAAVAAVVVVAAVIVDTDTEARRVTTDEGPSTSVVPATTSTTRVPPGPRPTTIVAITGDYRLVVIDAATGREIRELDRQADPQQLNDPDNEIAPNVLCGVTLMPDQRVFYDSCGEPAFGYVIGTSINGGEPQLLNVDGGHVAASRDERFVVMSGAVAIYDSENFDQLETYTLDTPGDDQHATWSPDDETIAFDEIGGPAPDSKITLLSVDDGTFRTLRAPAGASWSRPAFRGDGMLVVAEQCCHASGSADDLVGHVVNPATGEIVASFDYPGAVVDQEYDASGTWLIVTLADGRLFWTGGGAPFTQIPGDYVAADW
jgi:hypothetical protein